MNQSKRRENRRLNISLTWEYLKATSNEKIESKEISPRSER